MQRRALLVGLGALGAGCAPRAVARVAVAPWMAVPADLIPADLDVVARLDMARMKAVLGANAPDPISREVLSQLGGEGGEAEPLVVWSLLNADVVHLGYRPSPQLLPLDRVLAVQGRLGPLVNPPSGFSGATDLGGDFRYWDKQAGTLARRSGVARVYAQGERLRVFVSEAEIDAVERALAGLAGPRRLVPPEEGALSVALRPSLIGRLAGGSLRELLEQAKTLELVVDLESDVARLKLSLIASGPEQAERLVSAGEPVLSRALGDRALRAQLRAVGDRVTLSLRLGRAELWPLFQCWARPAAFDCR